MYSIVTRGTKGYVERELGRALLVGNLNKLARNTSCYGIYIKINKFNKSIVKGTNYKNQQLWINFDKIFKIA